MSIWLYYTLAVLLFISNLLGFQLNFAGLPGNLLIVGGTALFCWQVHSGDQHIAWVTVGVLAFLLLLGEAIEFFAGTVGAAKYKASRRSLALSIVGSVVGSLAGAFIGLPVPILGSAIAAVIGGAVGAAAGASLGENWKGRDADTTVKVGLAAFWGRIFGTAGKLIVAAIMLAIATVDSIW